MLLHNQKGFPISWEALSKTYEWAPFGQCDVPDMLVPHIKAEGLPVSELPVPPKVKADTALAAEEEAGRADAILQLKKKLELADDAVADAKSAVAAAEDRATQAEMSLLEAQEKITLLESQLKTSEDDSRAFEKMATDAQGEIAALKSSKQKSK